MDNSGKEIVPPKYDEILGFGAEHIVPVRNGQKWGFIDKTGKVVIPMRYDELGYFLDGKARAKLNGKELYIDKTGKEIH
ncbi:WG repeat-containing protein [Pedobacter sp. BS3]|uniref:WG repeat-containing protein n=1 Tax=Pedobacter sp. BS3 TaxID=2567937 RepID=UPI0011ED99A5|nr:WG repeat-containing protein [Pedobacter sp. BS3]TZF84076.1 WG repeat-containing protein [Pedobacter sp. BS3]